MPKQKRIKQYVQKSAVQLFALFEVLGLPRIPARKRRKQAAKGSA